MVVEHTAAIRYTAISRYEAIEEWARIRGDHSLLRDKTALAILTLAKILEDTDEDKKESIHEARARIRNDLMAEGAIKAVPDVA